MKKKNSTNFTLVRHEVLKWIVIQLLCTIHIHMINYNSKYNVEFSIY